MGLAFHRMRRERQQAERARAAEQQKQQKPRRQQPKTVRGHTVVQTGPGWYRLLDAKRDPVGAAQRSEAAAWALLEPEPDGG